MYRGTREGEHFMTIVSNHGILMRVDMYRRQLPETAMPPWPIICCADLYSMMRFPYTVEQAAAAGGIACFFSRASRRPAPKQRNAKQLKLAVGNAMHVAHVGAVLAVVLLRIGHLVQPAGGGGGPGKRQRPQSPVRSGAASGASLPAVGSDASFEAAIRAQYFRRRHQ